MRFRTVTARSLGWQRVGARMWRVPPVFAGVRGGDGARRKVMIYGTTFYTFPPDAPAAFRWPVFSIDEASPSIPPRLRGGGTGHGPGGGVDDDDPAIAIAILQRIHGGRVHAVDNGDGNFGAPIEAVGAKT